MKKILLTLGCLLFASTALYATPCEEVMQTIAEKIKNNGVKEFVLEAIDKGAPTDKKIVGVCAEGTKDIVYYRGKPEVSENPTVVVSLEDTQQKASDTTEVSEVQTAE
ncbi:MAG: DUF1161 domain-containing protein [Campylobacteraceae bacterium]|jgi:hypothetical protein|nr:DUF1161 domain-containing protein [Campylobacteraceae bacterium]